MRVDKVVVPSLIAVTAIVALACSGPDQPSVSSENKADASNAEEAGGADAAGSRDKPFAVGDAIEFDEWTIKLAKTDTDATDTVMSENEFNEIKKDETAVMVEVTTTYTGKDKATPWIELQFDFVAKDGTTHDTMSCGVIPGDLMEAGDLYTDASATGNVCALVPDDAIKDGAWRLSAGFTSEDGFVALK
jgi:hypothetical protein